MKERRSRRQWRGLGLLAGVLGAAGGAARPPAHEPLPGSAEAPVAVPVAVSGALAVGPVPSLAGDDEAARLRRYRRLLAEEDARLPRPVALPPPSPTPSGLHDPALGLPGWLSRPRR